MKQPSDKVGHSAAERQARYRKLHPERFYNKCVCGSTKFVKAKLCRPCEDVNKKGERSPFWKGGYERKIAYNRERASKLVILGGFGPQEWEELKAKYQFMCLCCKQQEPVIKLTRDHIVPISRGGSNNIENIQPLCMSCNLRKHTQNTDYRLSISI